MFYTRQLYVQYQGGYTRVVICSIPEWLYVIYQSGYTFYTRVVIWSIPEWLYVLYQSGYMFFTRVVIFSIPGSLCFTLMYLREKLHFYYPLQNIYELREYSFTAQWLFICLNITVYYIRHIPEGEKYNFLIGIYLLN